MNVSQADVSKIEAGRLTLESMEFDPRAVVEEVVELLSQRVSDKGLELAASVRPDVPARLRGDPGRLRQVLATLSATPSSSRNGARSSSGQKWPRRT